MSDLKRSHFGNKSDEHGAFDEGADPNAINISSLPHSRPHVEVNATMTEEGLELVPVSFSKTPNSLDFRASLASLEESPMDITMANILDDPDEIGLEKRVVNGVLIEVHPDRVLEIEKRSPREKLVWYGMTPTLYGAVLGDRVKVLKDVLESSYSCKKCRGEGMSEEICNNCNGTQREGVESIPCRSCRVLGFGIEVPRSCGLKPCDSCSGSGWKGGVIIPEQAQQEAITGIVVSLGPECKLLKIGDRVMHSRYAGHTLRIGDNNTIVTMRECEVLEILREKN